MSVMLWALGGLFLWWLVGTFVMAWIDTDGRLLAWAEDCPLGPSFGTWSVACAWPFILWLRRCS